MVLLILVLYFPFYVNLVFGVANFLVRNADPQLKHYFYDKKKQRLTYNVVLRLFHCITNFWGMGRWRI